MVSPTATPAPDPYVSAVLNSFTEAIWTQWVVPVLQIGIPIIIGLWLLALILWIRRKK